MMIYSPEERDLLIWLGEEEFSQYGECYGAALNTLLTQGLAEVMPEGADDHTFIARGRSIMYRAVRLTASGRKMLEDINATRS